MYSTENVYKRCSLTQAAHDMATEELQSLSSEDTSNIKVAAAACLNLLIGAYSGYLYAGAKCIPEEHPGLNSGDLVRILLTQMRKHKDHVSDYLWTGEGTALSFIFSTLENHFCNQ